MNTFQKLPVLSKQTIFNYYTLSGLQKICSKEILFTKQELLYFIEKNISIKKNCINFKNAKFVLNYDHVIVYVDNLAFECKINTTCNLNIIWEFLTNQITIYKRFIFVNDKFVLHTQNDDFPANIHYYQNGNPVSEEWCFYGQLYRDNDKPARIKYHYNGVIQSKEWFGNKNYVLNTNNDNDYCFYDDSNLLYRDNDKPARIEYFITGNVQMKEWWKNGRHRDNNKPAVIYYNNDGRKIREEWWKNGKRDNNFSVKFY